jgi:hypothetical protein
MHAGPCNRCNA